jgi:hypothetical protein
MALFLNEVMAELSGQISYDGIRVAGIIFADKAGVAFDFQSHEPSITASFDALIGPGRKMSGGRPTLMYKAIERARTDLLLPDGSTGFRNYAAPLIIVTISDGASLEPELLKEELNHSIFHPPSDAVYGALCAMHSAT